MKKLITAIFLIYLLPFIVEAQTGKSQVLILGTAHLEQISGFEASMLNNVIKKLDSFNFEAIGIEKMSGELLNDIQSRKDSAFDGITKGGFGAQYLNLADTVRKTQKITFLQAQKSINTLLKQESLSLLERKELLFNFLAVTDIPSAALQYLYINNKSLFTTEFERYIVEILEKKISSKNEYYSLALQLAKRGNLNQLEPIDNFQDEPLLFKYYPEFIDDYTVNAEIFAGISQLPIFQKTNQLTQEGIEAKDFSDLYHFLNSDEYISEDYNAQWAIWLKSNFPSGSDRARYYLWEMRNLQIAANIMNLVARNPQKKILIIIGASHKGFLEKYLTQIEDIEVLKYE